MGCKARNKVVVTVEGPGPDDQPAEFRETYDFRSPNEILLVGEMKQGNRWVQFMTTELKWKKPPAGGQSQSQAPRQ